jgi:hypothetical protein
MTAYVTFKCDGMMPPGSKERCRGGFSVQADDDDYRTAIEDAWDAAKDNGWTDTINPHGVPATLDFCPSCTRHRAEGIHP